MHFEHLIQINEPNNPFIETVSRDELWYGLMQRVDKPEAFLPGLESCTVVSRSDTVIERVLDFGPAAIRDRVTLQLGESVRFDIAAGETHAGGSLVIQIEEPEPFALFLRFTYATTLSTTQGEDAQYVGYVKSAYEQSNIDTVRVIRELLAQRSVH